MRVVLNFGIELRMDDFEIGTCYHLTLSDPAVSVHHLFRRQDTTHFTHIVYLCGSVLLTQYCAGDKIEKNEMGWACGAYG
jgi:hypothetical protein